MPHSMTPANDQPFFILGCVRSGTTMLRNVLRQHPHLASPEETHFYRHADPFGTPGYALFVNNPTLKQHRKIDGVSDDEFKAMLAISESRSELMQRYMTRYLLGRKPKATRWFDKTPQNIYGMAMLAADFPKANFVHIVRDPLDVVASLRIGKVMKIADLVGACNYWNESVVLMHQLKRLAPRRVLEIHYEQFTRAPMEGIRQILEFLGEDFDPQHYEKLEIAEVSHQDEQVLTPEEVLRVKKLCLRGRRLYGYAPRPAEIKAAKEAKLVGKTNKAGKAQDTESPA